MCRYIYELAYKIINIEEEIYIQIITNMIKNLSLLGGKDIVIPFVDKFLPRY